MIVTLVRRLLLGLLTLWVISVLVFAGTEILPGDVTMAILGQSATPEAKAVLRQQLHLDQPAPVRYWTWLTSAARGDFGKSLATGRPVVGLIGERFKNTLMLAALTAAFAVPLSVSLGLLSVFFRDGPVDRAISVVSLIAISLPEFFTGALLVALHLFPAVTLSTYFDSPARLLRALFLPMMTLTVAMVAHMTRMTQATLLDVLASPYVEMAHLKGIPTHRILLRHALPNALGPMISVIAVNLAYLASGVVVAEAVFAYPGFGRLMVDAVSSRDVPLVQAIALLVGSAYVLINLFADLAAITVNPRLRFPR
jgi:peptide/nickel transport system permease protein